MKSILVTYPDFRSLPKGIKRMLLTSESLFFEAAKPAHDPWASSAKRVTPGSTGDLRRGTAALDGGDAAWSAWAPSAFGGC